MKRGDIVFIKDLKEGDRFCKYGVRNKDVYKVIETGEMHYLCIKASIIDVKLKSYNPIPDCVKMKLENRVIYLRHEE